MTRTILVDWREKKPYQFPGIENVKEVELDVGDYTVAGFEDTFAVERKTLDDLASSVGTDRDRFRRELERGVDNGMAELVVIIEAPEGHVYDYSGEKYSPEYYSKIYPNSIIGTVDAWTDRYTPVRFEWAGNRANAKQETLRLLDKWYMQYNNDITL